MAALASGRVPPVVNHCEVDPVLGDIRLSKGGNHDAKCAVSCCLISAGAEFKSPRQVRFALCGGLRVSDHVRAVREGVNCVERGGNEVQSLLVSTLDCRIGAPTALEQSVISQSIHGAWLQADGDMAPASRCS